MQVRDAGVCLQEAIKSYSEEMKFVLLAFISGGSKLRPAGEIRSIIEIVTYSIAGTDMVIFLTNQNV